MKKLFLLRFLMLWTVFLPGSLHAQDLKADKQRAAADNRSGLKLADQLKWNHLPPLPSPSGRDIQPGLAGAFAGVHNDALIIAGGANFPEGKPWEGGRKVYHDAIYILKRNGDNYSWESAVDFRFPYAVAYGASVSTSKGIVCIGGMDEQSYFSQVKLLKWDAAAERVLIDSLPSLPTPLANMAAAAAGEIVFVAGGSGPDGSTNSFYRLNLDHPGEGWQQLPPVPALGFSHATAAVQSGGEYPCFYLFGGRRSTPSGISELYSHAFLFDPVKSVWKRITPIGAPKAETALSAGMAAVSGANYILLVGGDDGRIFHRIETLLKQAAGATNAEERKTLHRQLDEIREKHPGFNRNIYLYNTVTGSWTIADTSTVESQVTTTAVYWGDKIIFPSGEIAPGTRTPAIRALTISGQEHFTLMDYIVVLVYLALMVVIGFFTSKRQHSTEDYFRGGQRIPGWAAGMSIFGTQLSAITFMAIPAKTYATNWNYFFLLMTIIMVMPFIIRYFIPFFRKLNVTTAYEYLEKRFNYTTRFLAAFLFILLQIGRLAIVLLLPSLALTLVTGIDVYICILIMGGITILYTVMGGIEAVVWTDVTQVIVLLGGALVCIALILVQLGDGLWEAGETLCASEKLSLFDFRFTLEEPVFWVVVLGGLAINIVTYGSDQTVVQRYLTTRDEQAAKNSLRLGAWMTLPAALIFFTIGTLLFLFYREYPGEVNIILESQDSIFPWYIVSQLPPGISGLLIAAIFAAAMSTLSSSINSVSTAFVSDFYMRFKSQRAEKDYLLLARIVTVVTGVVGTILALLMARQGISSLWDQFNMILGLFTGGIGGVFLLGIFSRRANAAGAVTGLLLSGLVQYLVKEYTSLNLLMYAFTGCASCILSGYLFSLLSGGRRKDIKGLTIYSI